MKIRFWQKTYLFTLALFLLCLNAGILSLTIHTNRSNVRDAESTATSEQYYIARSFERDIEDLTSAGEVQSHTLLMHSYGTFYKERGILIGFAEEGEFVFSTYPLTPESVTAAEGTLHHTELDGERHILISEKICDGRYTMIFAKNVEYLDEEFSSMMLTFTLTSTAASAVLAVALFFVLKRLSFPLDRLRETTERIKDGDFSVSADESGRDEFAALAASFNSMLAKINEQMATLESDARQKQMLVDDMAHELRTPLTTIHGYAEYLEKAAVGEEERIIAAKHIMSESERLEKISEILLDGAFIRENPPEMSECDLSLILEETAKSLTPKADGKGVSIVCDTAPATVCGNPTLLSMLFYNLTENAIKACSQGGTVTLVCGANKALISDNGKGMSEEQLVHISEPFYRTDKSRSRAEGGVGLGLALCKRIADAHGATIGFESQIGVGTRVTVDFTT